MQVRVGRNKDIVLLLILGWVDWVGLGWMCLGVVLGQGVKGGETVAREWKFTPPVLLPLPGGALQVRGGKGWESVAWELVLHTWGC